MIRYRSTLRHAVVVQDKDGDVGLQAAVWSSTVLQVDSLNCSQSSPSAHTSTLVSR